MTTTDQSPSIAEVRTAATRISRVVWHTPLVRSAWLSERCRAEVWLKLEVVQTTGSFKIRGAMNALSALVERDGSARSVVTASAGNHGMAIAWAAKELGLVARVHLPVTAPAVKRRALLALGAELVEASTYDEAEARAREDAERTGAVYVSPYNDADVIAGAGTVALEMLADCPALDVLVVPLGGGGLLSGAALVAKAHRPDVIVIGAEAEASPVFTSSLAAGAITVVRVEPTLADGLAGNLEPGSRTFALVERLVDRVVLVAESSIALAMRGLLQHERLVAEGAAATAVGALLQGGTDVAGRRVGVILSGRNVDGDVIERVIGRSPTAAP